MKIRVFMEMEDIESETMEDVGFEIDERLQMMNMDIETWFWENTELVPDDDDFAVTTLLEREEVPESVKQAIKKWKVVEKL